MEQDQKFSSQNITTNLTWKFSERLVAEAVTFTVTVLLARMLSPDDFGLIAMVTVFVTISNIFLTSGLSDALIQKLDANEIDFSSMFYLNIIVSLVLYAILFFAAGPIASFYDHTILEPLLRILGLRLLFAAINSIQCAYISRNMMFRQYFYSTLSSKIISGMIGISMAILGFGVWSLAGQYLFSIVIETSVLWFRVKWRPKAIFSRKSILSLYSYAWKNMASGLLETVSSQLRSLIIGKKYSSADLAYYDKGIVYPNNIITNIVSAIRAVMFPVLSNAQNDAALVKRISRRWLKLLSFIVFPIMVGLAVVAKPLILVLLTEKWVLCVPYLQIACLAYGIWTLEVPLRVTLNALGRVGITLKILVIKNVFSVILLIIIMDYGVMAIAWSLVASYVLSFWLTYLNCKGITYSRFFELLRDILPAILLSAVMGTAVYGMSLLGLSTLLTLLIQISSGILIYAGLAWAFKVESFSVCVDLLFRRGNKNPRKAE